MNIGSNKNTEVKKLNETRENALIQFHPNIAQGRQKVFQEWEKYQSI
ncbi:hypothetical protein [Lederbergia ruris]